MHASSVVLISLFTSAITAVSAVYVIQRFEVLPSQAQPTSNVVVPEFQGLLEADARRNAEVAHVALLVAGREASDTAKDGTVVRQSVPAGQQVPPNHPVSIVLAQEVLKVPEVTGLSVADATLLLKAKGYELKAGESVPNAKIESGRIVEQTPAAGAELARGQVVTVKTSAGVQEVEVPKLIGLSHNDAKAQIEKLGLVAKMGWVSLAETPSYRVIGQKPAAGDKLKPGETISLVVNR